MNNRFKDDSPEYVLDNFQTQCDMGGVQIQVSRQALNEVLDKLAEQDVIQKQMRAQLIKDAKVEVLDKLKNAVLEKYGYTFVEHYSYELKRVMLTLDKLKAEISQ